MSSRTMFSLIVLITAVIVISLNEAQGSYYSDYSDDYSDEDWDWMPGEGPPSRDDEVHKIYASSNWGNWGDWEYCPHGFYAYTARVKFQDWQEAGDDSATNGIQLYCAKWNGETGHSITSRIGHRGTWKDWHGCKHGGRIIGFTLGVEPYMGHCHKKGPPGSCDDTATSNLRLHCGYWRNGHLEAEATHELYHASWGKWQKPQMCTKGTYVCGIQTQIDDTGNQQDAAHGDQDITGLNGVGMACCTGEYM